MALTGRPDEPLGPPERLVGGVERLAPVFPGLDPLTLLGERAALMGLWRRGTTSCGGSCRLFPAGDGWLAVSLPRAEDLELVPAWLELDDTPRTAPGTWSAIGETVRSRDPAALVERAAVLGLPVTRLGEAADATAVVAERLGESPPTEVAGPARRRPLRPVGRSTLWGPAGGCRGHGGESGVDQPPRRGPARCGRVLRPPELAQELRCPRSAEQRGDASPARVGPAGRRRD